MSQVDVFIEEIKNESEKEGKSLVIIVGKPGSGKSKFMRQMAKQEKWNYIDSRVLITEEFLDIAPEERNEKAPALMNKILDQYNSDVILIDRVQTLFVPLFQIEIRRFLNNISQKKTIVMAWPGSHSDGKLHYERYDGSSKIEVPTDGYKILEVE